MPANHNALIRYHIYEKCFKDRLKKYTWRELAAACETHYTDNGLDIKVPSERTVKLDIQKLKNGTLGFRAPILYTYEDGYHYTNPDFSIHHVPLNKNVLNDISEGIRLLKSVLDLEVIEGISESVVTLQRAYNLEDVKQPYPLIRYEEGLNEVGKFNLDTIYRSLPEEKCLRIEYKPFDEEKMSIFLHPYFIKNYNHRWYVFGFNEDLNKIINLSIDRVVSVSESLRPYIQKDVPAFLSKLDDIYGVTILDDDLEHVRFRVNEHLFPYLLTKPFHKSQQLIDRDARVFSIDIIPNYEIIHKLLSYGGDLEVLQPQKLRDQMIAHVDMMIQNYRR